MDPVFTILFILVHFQVLIVATTKASLRFNEHGKFKIVNFADLHFHEVEQDLNIKSIQVMTDILAWETPELVVFTGDQIRGGSMPLNATAYVDMLLQPIVQGNYRWASTYGNHDVGQNVSREDILATEQKYDNCYTLQGEEGLPGLTNYYLLVYPHESEHNQITPALVLWFFDTQGGHNATFDFPSVVDEAVVAWFYRENQKIMENWGSLPALAFFHIPTIEYKAIQETISEDPRCNGLIGKKFVPKCIKMVVLKPRYIIFVYMQDDTVVPQERDTGFMKALISSGTVKTAFVGHDHGNSWCCYYEALEICYNRNTGYGGYGDTGNGFWSKGARVVEASYDQPWGKYLNYVRLEDGSIIDNFPTNP